MKNLFHETPARRSSPEFGEIMQTAHRGTLRGFKPSDCETTVPTLWPESLNPLSRCFLLEAPDPAAVLAEVQTVVLGVSVRTSLTHNFCRLKSFYFYILFCFRIEFKPSYPLK